MIKVKLQEGKTKVKIIERSYETDLMVLTESYKWNSFSFKNDHCLTVIQKAITQYFEEKQKK